jgi:GAF domain-containing protein
VDRSVSKACADGTGLETPQAARGSGNHPPQLGGPAPGVRQDEQARRAEQFAAWVRLDLDEPQAARRLYTATRELREVPRPGLLFGKILEGALTLAGADRGNVQVLDPATGSLRIAAQAGFGAEFLEYFAVVDDARSACGRAARERTQTVVIDVSLDAWFAPHRDIAAAAAFRAVQSTPLIDRSGRLLGVVSTHYPRPYSPSARDREIIKRYAELAGQIIADRLRKGDGEALGPAIASRPLLGAADSRPPAPAA